MVLRLAPENGIILLLDYIALLLHYYYINDEENFTCAESPVRINCEAIIIA